jgi:Calx-beta domain/Beta-propeller repeat/Carboxypeptidase regulatory-like domain
MCGSQKPLNSPRCSTQTQRAPVHFGYFLVLTMNSHTSSCYPRINRTVLVIGMVCLLTTFAGVIFVTAQNPQPELASGVSPQDGAPAPTEVDPATRARIAENFGKLPIGFEINKGQTDPSVKFLSRGPGYDLFLTATEAVLRVPKPFAPKAEKLKEPATAKTDQNANVSEGTVLRLKLLGANVTPEVEGQEELPGQVNYFRGNDPEKWQREVPTYRKAYLKNVYPGIDVVYYGNQGELEYDFVLAPRANPKLIRFTVTGADKIRLEKSGRLLLTLKHGEVSLNKPVIYQLGENGSRREVKGGYSVTGNEVRFKVESFDSGKPLVIDPVLSYSTLLGGSFGETAFGIAVDTGGNAYVTGTTSSTNFPTTAGAFKTTGTAGDIFVSKLNATGTALVYSTFITGGNFFSTSGNAIAVDATGNAHVTGTSSDTNFPIVNGLKTTSNFFKTSDAAANWSNQNSGLVGGVNALSVSLSVPNTIYAATSDGFYRSADGGAVWTKTTSTGLSGANFATALAVHPTNSLLVYVATFNGLFRTINGGNTWASVSTGQVSLFSASTIVFDPVTPSTIYVGSGNGVLKSTDSGVTWITQNNFGIPGTPQVRALAINPTTPLTIYAGTAGSGLFKSTNGGGVWTAMNNGMGGSNPTTINTIAIDPSNTSTLYTGHGNTGGINKSTNAASSWAPLTNGVPAIGVSVIVVTPGAVYAGLNGGGVIKTTNGGTNWTNANTGLWSLFVSSLVKHPSNASTLYVGTNLVSSRDAFVTKLNSAGSALLFSTLLGGSSEELGNGIAVDGSGNIYVVGQTASLNFPVANAFQAAPVVSDFCGNGFVTKINPSVPSFAFSTYLGGASCDVANSVAVDASGNVYVTGSTSSADFPTANAFQPNMAGQFNTDSFATKLTTSGAAVYSTYLGGDSTDIGFGITADPSGNAYVTGLTFSFNFPTMNPIQAANGSGNGDVFVTKINSTGSALIYSTYLGGTGGESGRGIARDSSNNIYVTGFTDSVDFPLVAGALRTKSPMYKSIDGAANWGNDNYGFTVAGITAIAVHPTQTSTVYVGTQNGVFKTTNGGRTWAPINNGLDNRFVLELVIDPSTPSTLYVATGGFASSNSGVYKSTDGGNVWNRRVNGMSSTDLMSLAIDPVTPNTLYAGFFGGSGNSGRVYKTTNGADDWAVVGNAPPFTAQSLVVDPLNHNTLYAADSSNSNGAIFKSINAGTTWAPVGFAQTGPFGRSVSVSPLTAGLVYADTNLGLFRSTNGGTTFSPVPSRRGTVVFDPVNPSTHYLVTPSSFFGEPGGVFKSTNNGGTWVPMNKGLNSPTANELAIDPTRPSTLYLGSTPNNSGSDAFVTKINPAGNALIYSTFIGGPLDTNNFSGVSAQAFGIAVDSAGNAYITGLTTATNFPVTPNSFQPFIRGGQDAFISKLTMSHIISGTVLDTGGLPVSGADVVLNDGTSLVSIPTESDGSYQFSRLRQGGSFTVSATKAHFTMAPVSQTFNNLQSNQVLNFTATATNAPFHIISGKVSENGVGLSGVTVTLSGSQPGLRVTDSNGNYSFELAAAGNYTVTPAILGFNFGPANATFNNLSAAQTANFTANRQNFVVTNTNNHGTGSLREAIINANATPGTDTVVFNIPGAGVKVINLIIGLPEITDRVVIDATTQPGYAGTPLIELDGLSTGSNANCLVIKAASSTVRGLAIGNFRSGSAIWLNGVDSNVIQSNYIGLAADGTTAKPNNRGILLNNSSSNQIGGTTAAARNVISGNQFGSGIEINGNSNVIQGNFIGTNAAGTAGIPNSGSGVVIFNATSINNIIGGTAAGSRNVISGNQTGISTSGNNTTIQGNLIGTDVTGTIKVPNSSGIQAIGENILIGGLTAGSRNVISGSLGDGVVIRGAGSKMQGNFVGTDITGTLALGNNNSGVVAGDGALVGGTVTEARNIISANGNFANLSLGQNFSGGSPVIVQGNYIGTDVTGTRSLGGNAASGINIASNNNQIGGPSTAARNVISGNRVGIQLGGFFSGVVGNVIQGNVIGVNAAGTGQLPNANQGIAISDATNNTIGGTQVGAGNRIAFNGGPGITVSSGGGSGGSGNTIRGNSIFSNTGLGIDLGSNGVTANDSNDGDSGPNQLQNFPVITGVISSSGSTTINGNLRSIPNTAFQVDFYSSSAVDPSGNGEGAQFFNSTSVNTNNNGDATINVTFPAALPAGRVITATATDPNGNTSEFSGASSNAAVGSVQFSVSSLTVLEDVGMAQITVLRTGGSSGGLSVQYATANGSAIAGQDYTAASGTLTFNAGQTSRTIQVPITNDSTTEADETFTIALSSTDLQAVGAPSTMTVTIQDSTTTLALSINNLNVIEGPAGTTTQALFIISISAATGRTVTGNFGTSPFVAIPGDSCNTPNVDFERVSGSFTIQPGNTSFAIPVKICGDTNAEGFEGFQVALTNITNATLTPSPQQGGFGIIVNDDELELLLEESGPTVTQAAALESRLKLRDPFNLLIPEWITGETDRNTRITLFVRNLRLDPGEPSTAVNVRFIASNGLFFQVAAADVRSVPDTEFTQVSVRLPNGLPPGTTTVFVLARSLTSNAGTITIAP